MKNEKEFVGTLRGFDDYVNMVLDDVTEYDTAGGAIVKTSKLDSALVNGINVAMLVPGSSPQDAARLRVGPATA